MRVQSAEKYGVDHLKGKTAPEDDALSPDERAEAKFGIKGLGIALAAVCIAIAFAVVLPIVL